MILINVPFDSSQAAKLATDLPVAAETSLVAINYWQGGIAARARSRLCLPFREGCWIYDDLFEAVTSPVHTGMEGIISKFVIEK